MFFFVINYFDGIKFGDFLISEFRGFFFRGISLTGGRGSLNKYIFRGFFSVFFPARNFVHKKKLLEIGTL